MSLRAKRRAAGVAIHARAVVPEHRPATRPGRRRQRLAIHDRVGKGLRAIVVDPLLDRRRQLGADADRDARDRHGHGAGQRLQALARAGHGGGAHVLDQLHHFGERHHPRAGRAQVTAHRPRAFVVMGVRRHAAFGQFDLPAIEQLAPGRDRHQHRRVAVLGDADGCGPPRAHYSLRGHGPNGSSRGWARNDSCEMHGTSTRASWRCCDANLLRDGVSTQLDHARRVVRLSVWKRRRALAPLRSPSRRFFSAPAPAARNPLLHGRRPRRASRTPHPRRSPRNGRPLQA